MAKAELTDTQVQGRPETNGHVRVLLPAEAAEFLRVSIDQLYHLTSQKKVPFTKVGGALRFDRERLEEFIANRGAEEAASETGNRGIRKGAARGSAGRGSLEPSTDRSKFRFKTPPRPGKADR